jgi:hypothetical protein
LLGVIGCSDLIDCARVYSCASEAGEVGPDRTVFPHASSPHKNNDEKAGVMFGNKRHQ